MPKSSQNRATPKQGAHMSLRIIWHPLSCTSSVVAFASFFSFQVFSCSIFWPLLRFHFPLVLSLIHMAATFSFFFLHTAHTFRINRQKKIPEMLQNRKLSKIICWIQLTEKQSPWIAIPKSYTFEDQNKAYKNWFSKGHFHLIFPVVAENRTLYISKIITEENKSIPNFLMLPILRLKLSLETHIIAIHKKPLKWALGNSLKEFPTFLCYFKIWVGWFRNLNSLYWFSG